MKSRQYPIWLFHKEQAPEGKVVHSAEQEEKLGKGWVESPLQFSSKVEEKKPEEQKKELEEQAKVEDGEFSLEKPDADKKQSKKGK